MRRIVHLFLALGLVGCASSPITPQLSEYQYGQYVKYKMTALKCVENGGVSPEVGALAVGYADTNLSKYLYDYQKLSAIWSQADSTYSPTQSDCNTLAMYVAQNKIEETKVQEQNSAKTTNNYYTAPPVYVPRAVTCSTYAGVTTCF